jgi:EAL domain-containing protein (putative c-di-GMP-specific phosphodiesterase class I)
MRITADCGGSCAHFLTAIVYGHGLFALVSRSDCQISTSEADQDAFDGEYRASSRAHNIICRRAIAERVLTAVRAPFIVGQDTFALSASLGVCLSEPSFTADQLMHQVDQAMYVTKRGGGGRVQLGRPDNVEDVTRRAQATRHLRLLGALGSALERDELILYGQPVLDLLSRRVVKVEALLRWVHPDGTILAPGEFLDVAEETDVIHPIGRRVLHESCRMAAAWVEVLGLAAPVVHVNVSGRQLEVGNLHREVLGALSESGLVPPHLVLELTETRMPSIANSTRNDLQDLRDRGVRVAIDDFGTGYSSLTRLTQLPIDILKIDKSFVAGMENDPACAAVVQGVLSIGGSLGLDVIAEGVETPAQALGLLKYGCTKAQGFLYSPPLPEQALLSYLAQALRP